VPSTFPFALGKDTRKNVQESMVSKEIETQTSKESQVMWGITSQIGSDGFLGTATPTQEKRSNGGFRCN